METPPLNPLPPPSSASHLTPRGYGDMGSQLPSHRMSAEDDRSALDLRDDLRALTLSALSSDSPRQAQFFADKLVACAGGGWFNALLLGRAHAAVGELRRAVLCLESVTCSADVQR